MRKQALVHIHALISEIRAFIMERESVPMGAFATYDQIGILPTEIHYNKRKHKESIFTLLEDILMSLERLSTRNLIR
uniref:UPF0058 family protein n=2 Tax=Natrinema halophilum TaxID=1699371 RepID=A0A7D5GKK1_9EURY